MRFLILVIFLSCASAFLNLAGHPKGDPISWFEKRSTHGYFLLNGCGVDPTLGLSPTDALAACALLDYWITLHISIEGAGFNPVLFNLTVAQNMSYTLAIGYNSKGRDAARQLYTNVIAVQAQPIVNFTASEIYGIVDSYNPVNQTVSGRVPIYVFGQLNFTQRCDVLLYGVCPNGALINIQYEVRINMIDNQASMKQVFYRPEEMAYAVGINSRNYLNSLKFYSTVNPQWFAIWEDPLSNTGTPSRPLSSPDCRFFND